MRRKYGNESTKKTLSVQKPFNMEAHLTTLLVLDMENEVCCDINDEEDVTDWHHPNCQLLKKSQNLGVTTEGTLAMETKSEIQTELKNILKFDLSLKKISTIATAVQFWEFPKVKRKICQFMFSSIYVRDMDDSLVSWKDQVINYVIGLVDSSGVPWRIKDDIKYYVFTIGGLIYGFNMHIKSHGCDINFGLNISWLPYGRIDEVKMAREWLRKSSKKLNCLCFPDLYAEEDLIRKSMLSVKERISAELMELKQPASVEAMFLFCFEKSNREYLFASRYLWNELDVKKKKELVGRVVTVLSESSPFVENMYEKQKRTELLLFFWKEMSIITPSNYYMRYSTLFKALLRVWPYQDLILNIIENHLKNFTYNEFKICLDLVAKCLSPEFKEIIYEHRDDCLAILRKLLEEIPKQIKLEYFMEYIPLFFPLPEYFHHASMLANDASLKEFRPTIIHKSKYFFEKLASCGNFSDLKKYTEQLLYDGEIKLLKRNLNMINKFVRQGKFEMATQNINWICETQTQINERILYIDPIHLRQFLHERKFDLAEKFVVWRNDTQANQAKDPVELLCSHLITENQFDIIPQYLTWRFENGEEREKVKNALYATESTDPVEFCRELINENKFEEAQKYLTWRFGNEEEVRNVKKIINTSDVYLRNKIYEIWFARGSYHEALRKCDSFLKLFLESDEAVKEFITNKLFEKESYLQTFAGAPYWSCEEFLNYCFLTRKKIDEMTEERAQWLSKRFLEEN